MSIRVGILIIGSLFWRENRQSWRDQRLSMADAVSVDVPIRYGRLSQSQTYTMIFSPTASKGTAKVVPCTRAVNTFADLKIEAVELWKAETNEQNPLFEIATTWGCVAMLRNPTSEVDKYLTEWTTFLQSNAQQHAIYTGFPAVGAEVAAVNTNGLLQICWPTARNGQENSLQEMDILLATPNYPYPIAGNVYPSVQVLAAAWNLHGHRDYFDNNRANGFTTFQDDALVAQLI